MKLTITETRPSETMPPETTEATLPPDENTPYLQTTWDGKWDK
jgi:hypothetical protein